MLISLWKAKVWNLADGTDVEQVNKVLKMLGIGRHIKLIGSFAALLFTLGSSGVAVVIHSCSMMPVMACCEHMQEDPGSQCMDPSAVPGTQALQNDMSCNSTRVIGGLTTNPGVVDHSQKVQPSNAFVVPVHSLVEIFSAPNVCPWIHPFETDVSPPSVGKHILNASLLI